MNRPGKRVGSGRIMGQNESITKKGCFGSGRNGFGSGWVLVGTGSGRNGFGFRLKRVRVRMNFGLGQAGLVKNCFL
ncbi:hypothetical protein Hanom_Chr07g00643991 [Helianthus anomalus]